jgi:hypothetical protein
MLLIDPGEQAICRQWVYYLWPYKSLQNTAEKPRSEISPSSENSSDDLRPKTRISFPDSTADKNLADRIVNTDDAGHGQLLSLEVTNDAISRIQVAQFLLPDKTNH